MATTSAHAARELLRALDARGMQYVVLHGAERIRDESSISDIDVLISVDPWRFLNDIIDGGGLGEFRLVMMWEYDVGALTTFWMLPNGVEGVQLDLMYDPSGIGKYGFRSEVAATSYRESTPWPPHLSQEAESLYLLSKRITKGDQSRQRDLVQSLKRQGISAAVWRDLLTAKTARSINGALAGRLAGPAHARLTTLKRRVSPRGVDRIFKPVGVVVDVGNLSDDALRNTVLLLERVLVAVKVVGSRGMARRLLVSVDIRRPTVILKRSGLAPRDVADTILWLANRAEQIVRRRVRASGSTAHKSTFVSSLVLVGPDGVGKSYALELILRAVGNENRITHIHSHPRVLPVLRRHNNGSTRDHSKPHEAPPHGTVLSSIKLLVVYLDWLYFYFLRPKRPADILLVERGWWDQVVDPRRYRLSTASLPFATVLGRMLPKPARVLYLRPDPELVFGRKPELSISEIRSQYDRWDRVVRSAAQQVVVYTSSDSDAKIIDAVEL